MLNTYFKIAKIQKSFLKTTKITKNVFYEQQFSFITFFKKNIIVYFCLSQASVNRSLKSSNTSSNLTNPSRESKSAKDMALPFPAIADQKYCLIPEADNCSIFLNSFLCYKSIDFSVN
jgi:hypothetical protein